jgi:UDP-N-acetylglucosamine transferase subunit ALG13
MIFLTVGTLFPFDRLVKAVDDAIEGGVIKQPVFGQIGETSLKPKYMEYTQMLTKNLFDEKVSTADYIISHAGIGSIVMALEHGKPLLVMPRMKRFKEHVNDHQVATARKFEELGHILAAYSEEELPGKLHQLKTFVPKPRENQANAVAERIAKFLELLGRKKILG